MSAVTFHAIGVPDRTVLVAEDLRVLAPGSTLTLFDLFPRGYGVRNVPELLEKVRQQRVDDMSFRPLKEAGVDLGRLSQLWGMAYLSGGKRSS